MICNGDELNRGDKHVMLQGSSILSPVPSLAVLALRLIRRLFVGGWLGWVKVKLPRSPPPPPPMHLSSDNYHLHHHPSALFYTPTSLSLTPSFSLLPKLPSGFTIMFRTPQNAFDELVGKQIICPQNSYQATTLTDFSSAL
jgi:hypothetical protein